MIGIVCVLKNKKMTKETELKFAVIGAIEKMPMTEFDIYEYCNKLMENGLVKETVPGLGPYSLRNALSTLNTIIRRGK